MHSVRVVGLLLIDPFLDPQSETKNQDIGLTEEDPVGSTCDTDVVSLKISYWELPKLGYCSYVGISNCAVLDHIA